MFERGSVAEVAAAGVQSGEPNEVLLAKYRECLAKLAAESKHFAGSVDAFPERGEDALGWAGRQDGAAAAPSSLGYSLG